MDSRFEAIIEAIGIEPYYRDDWITQYYNDALHILPELPDDSIDLLVTDPPYGIGFMGKDWDKALPDKKIWLQRVG